MFACLLIPVFFFKGHFIGTIQVIPASFAIIRRHVYMFLYVILLTIDLFLVFVDAGYIQENGILNLERYKKYIAALAEVLGSSLISISYLPCLHFTPVCGSHLSPIWRTSLIKRLKRKGKNTTEWSSLIWMSVIKISFLKWWNPMLLEYSGCCSTITLECHHGTGGYIVSCDLQICCFCVSIIVCVCVCVCFMKLWCRA